jgi:inorganic pyrophosphatase
MSADADDDVVKVLVEIPKGSRNKYELDPETGRIELDRRLFASVSYPTEYGFVPETDDGEGEELDVLVCATEATFPGCQVRIRPVGVLRMRMGDGDGPANPKLVGVTVGDPAWEDITEAAELPSELREEIEHFFSIYKDLEGGSAQVEGWGDRSEALRVLGEARELHRGG